MIKLHLGSGGKNIYGFINIDIRADCGPDLIMDITNISSKWYEEVDLIYSSHTLEHFPRKPIQGYKTYKEVLKNWKQALKPGGTLRLSVPDFEAICHYYLKEMATSDGLLYNDEPIRKLYGLVGGGQKNDFDVHYNIFDFPSLSRDLIDLGFENVKVYDWKKTEHSYIDDYSQAYIPHLDKGSGKLMSLNIEATKKK